MQAVIMAGGKGTRLSSVTKDIPKPMVLFAGKPLLEYQIENLRICGVKDIIIITGYLGDVIKDHFQDGTKFGVRIKYYHEDSPLGTAGALYFLKDSLEDNFILLFGDLFIDINFGRLFQYHLSKNAFATLYAHPNSHPYDSDILVTDNNHRVIGWSYKDKPRKEEYKNLVNAGIYVISKTITKYIQENVKTDLEKDIFVPLIDKKNIYAYPCTEYVKDIGTPERLIKVESDYLNGVCAKRNLKFKQKCVFLDRDGTINKYVGFLRNKKQMELEKEVAEAIKLLNTSEYLAIVISNQPVVARGECTLEELNAIHNHLEFLLGEQGAYLDDLYFCPHHPDKGFEGEVKELKIECNCRKPKTGMIDKAVKDHNIDLENSWFIGDTTIDIKTGQNAGCHTALVLTGEAGNDNKYKISSEIKGETLLECINQVLSFYKENKK